MNCKLTRLPVVRTSLIALLCIASAGCEGDASDALGKAYASVKQAVSNRIDGKSPAAASDKPKRRNKREHLVELTEVRSEALHITSVYSGSLRARKRVRIHAQEEGRITEVPWFEGDEVVAGERLFALDDELLKAALSRADALVGEARANVRRLDGLRARRMVGEDEFLKAQTALRVADAEQRVLQTRVGYAAVAAPFAGVVSERLVEPGDVVSKHQHILTLIDPTSLTLDIRAAEELVAHLEPGNPVRVRIDALGVADFAGKVVRVFPEVDARTRQGRVEIALEQIPEGARPGQFARVTFNLDTFARAVLPFGALRRDRDAEYVFVVGDDQVAQRVVVRSGRRVADKVQILEGLEAGQRVVLRGFLGLTSGKKVKPVSSKSAVNAS